MKNNLKKWSIDLEYAYLFVKYFRTMRKSVVEGTIWYDLWLESAALTDLQLVKQMAKIAKNSDGTNCLYHKYTGKTITQHEAHFV